MLFTDKELNRKLEYLGLNSSYGVSPSVNASSYSKALAEFYSKEREDMDLYRKLEYLGLTEWDSSYEVSPSVNASSYSKALAEFYSKEREDIDLYTFIRNLRDGDAHVVARRDRVNQVDKAIKKVIFNDPATVILWKDGSKTVVKCGEHEKYDPEKGFAMALAKRYLGNMGNYYELFKRHLPEKKFTPDDNVLVRAKLVEPCSTRKGNTKYIISLPGHTARYVVDEEYLVEVEE